MAVGPSVANVVLVKTKGTIGGTPWNCLFHLQYTGPAPAVADLTAIGTTINSAVTTNIGPLMGAATTFAGVDLADLTNPAAAQASVATSFNGARTGGNLVASAACVVSWNINVRYRGGHPRTYWPIGTVTDLATARTWTTTFQTLVTTNNRALRTAFNNLNHGTTTYKMVTVSFRSNNLPRPMPLPFTVNDAQVHGRVDTQRRRLGKETP